MFTKKQLILTILFIAVLPVLAFAYNLIDLPQTGQSLCYVEGYETEYCAGTGQDGEFQAGVSWPYPRFTDNGDCVTDNLTGLVWAKDGNLANGVRTWNEAVDYVSTVGLCGNWMWRLPNINELESLVNAGVNAGVSDQSTWLNGLGFTNVQPGYYWSSTTSAFYEIGAWKVRMSDGLVFYSTKSDLHYVWPVSGGDSSYPAKVWQTGQTTVYRSGDDGNYQKGADWNYPRFTDLHNGAVIDNLTGLEWSADANSPSTFSCPVLNHRMLWQEALDYVMCLNSDNFLGHNDWRLPNRKELRSLIDYGRYTPALPYSFPFTNVQIDERYWSSTTRYFGGSSGSAWYVDMYSGTVGFWFKVGDDGGNGIYVWPVRGGMIPSLDYYCDDDTDGYVDSSIDGTCTGGGCVPAGCQTTPGDDCDDSSASINPGVSEVLNNGIDDDCNPDTPTAALSGNAYNYPVPLFQASLNISVTSVRYYYSRNRLSLTSISITEIISSGGTAVIKGTAKVNGVGGFVFTATVTDGSPDAMGIEIRKPDGTLYYNAPSQAVSSGNFVVVGQ